MTRRGATSPWASLGNTRMSLPPSSPTIISPCSTSHRHCFRTKDLRCAVPESFESGLPLPSRRHGKSETAPARCTGTIISSCTAIVCNAMHRPAQVRFLALQSLSPGPCFRLPTWQTPEFWVRSLNWEPKFDRASNRRPPRQDSPKPTAGEPGGRVAQVHVFGATFPSAVRGNTTGRMLSVVGDPNFVVLGVDAHAHRPCYARPAPVYDPQGHSVPLVRATKDQNRIVAVTRYGNLIVDCVQAHAHRPIESRSLSLNPADRSRILVCFTCICRDGRQVEGVRPLSSASNDSSRVRGAQLP